MCHTLLGSSLAAPFASMFASQKRVLEAGQRWLKGPIPLSLGRGQLELPSWQSHLHVGVASLLPKTRFPKLEDAYNITFPAVHGGLPLLFAVCKLRDSSDLGAPVAMACFCLFPCLFCSGFISTHLHSDIGG